MSEARTRWVFLFIGVPLFALTYANSLHNSFQYDDFHSIVENPHIRDLSDLADMVTRTAAFSSMPERAMFRPLVVASLALNYAAGRYEVVGYHLVNLAVHLACAVLVAAICLQLGLPASLAGLAALLFALHPIQSEVANYVSSRSESLAALGYLASLASYLRWRATARPWPAAASLGAYAMGLLAKATAIALPLAIAIHELLSGDRKRARRALLSPQFAAYLALAVAYALVVGGLAATALSTPVRPLHVQVLTQLKAGVYYLWLVAMPVRLTVEHAFAPSGTLLDATVLLAGALLLSGLVTAACLWRRLGRGPWISLVAWAVVAALPASLVPLNVLVNEHRLYLSVAFAAPLGAAALWSVLPGQTGGHRGGSWPRWGARGRWALGVAVVAVLAVLTHQRNRVWADELTLWRDAASKAPGAYRAHMHLGGALEKSGRPADALAAFERAVQLAPETAETHYNRANVLRALGRLDQAKSAYTRSLSVDATFVPALVNLAAAEQETGQLARAEDLLLRAGGAWPAAADIQRRLGTVYSAQRRWLEAEAAYRRALALDPGLAETHHNLGNMHFEADQYDRAVASYRDALAAQASHSGARYNLADLLVRLGEFSQAESLASEGLRRFPAQVKLYYPLARAQDAMGRTAAAADSYRRFLELASDSSAARQVVEGRIRELQSGQSR